MLLSSFPRLPIVVARSSSCAAGRATARPLPSNCTRALHATVIRRGHFKDVDSAMLDGLSKNKNLLLVDFYADWCKPCHMLSPILEKLANDPEVKSGSGLAVDLVTIDTESDAGYHLSRKYSVRAMPTVVALRDGKEVDRFVGALTEPGVIQFLSSV